MGQVQVAGFVTWIVKMLFLQVILFISILTAQDDFGGGEDAGADMDLDSMMGGDSGGMDDKNPSLFKTVMEKSLMEETKLALQQLGVIVGVAFMVGFLFMAMVGFEKLWEKMEDKYQQVTGKAQEPEKDPASLVGTFSRYK